MVTLICTHHAPSFTPQLDSPCRVNLKASHCTAVTSFSLLWIHTHCVEPCNSAAIGSVTSGLKSDVSSWRFTAADISVVAVNSLWRESEVRGRGAAGMSWNVMSVCCSEGSEEKFLLCRQLHQWMIASASIHCRGTTGIFKEPREHAGVFDVLPATRGHQTWYDLCICGLSFDPNMT